MTVGPDQAAAESEDEPFSDRLERWLGSDGPKTIGDLGEFFAEKSFAVTILVLMFFPALPLPTGGISHVFEAITVVLALELVIGRRTIWLPERWRRREIGSTTLTKGMPFIARRIRWFERFSRPRGLHIFRDRFPRALLGLIIAVFAAAAAISPPFSGLDTVPSMGAVVVALSIILEDVVVLFLGIALGIGGIALSVTLGAAALRVLRDLF